ncbi:MAG: hypothetical protein ABR566_06155 [Pyrinomonadaceae bacterium]
MALVKAAVGLMTRIIVGFIILMLTLLAVSISAELRELPFYRRMICAVWSVSRTFPTAWVNSRTRAANIAGLVD